MKRPARTQQGDEGAEVLLLSVFGSCRACRCGDTRMPPARRKRLAHGIALERRRSHVPRTDGNRARKV